MHKGLLTLILLSMLSASGLLLSPDTYAKRVEPVVTYGNNPENDIVDAVVYPNPAEENIFVRLDLIDPSLTTDSEVELEIRNILGNTMPVESEAVDASRFRILTSEYPSGYYLLIVRCKECGANNRSIKNVFKFLKK